MQQLIVFDKKISLGTEPNPNQSQLPLLSAFFFLKKKKKKTNKKRKQQTQTLLQLKYIFNFFRGIAQRLA